MRGGFCSAQAGLAHNAVFILTPAFGIPSPRHGGSLKKCTDKFGEGQ
jgi:hypothetical protein